jgi:hypothetical protein
MGHAKIWLLVGFACELAYTNRAGKLDQIKKTIGKYLIFYNINRPHSSLDGQISNQAYFTAQSPI